MKLYELEVTRDDGCSMSQYSRSESVMVRDAKRLQAAGGCTVKVFTVEIRDDGGRVGHTLAMLNGVRKPVRTTMVWGSLPVPPSEIVVGSASQARIDELEAALDSIAREREPVAVGEE